MVVVIKNITPKKVKVGLDAIHTISITLTTIDIISPIVSIALSPC